MALPGCPLKTSDLGSLFFLLTLTNCAFVVCFVFSVPGFLLFCFLVSAEIWPNLLSISLHPFALPFLILTHPGKDLGLSAPHTIS